MELSTALQSILELQLKWDQRLNSPAMKARGAYLKDDASNALENIVRAIGDVGFSPKVDASNGIGGAARIPWLRVFSDQYSPRPTGGWYLSYLFAADGHAVYLALLQGVTNQKAGEKGSVHPLEAAAGEAKRFLGDVEEHRFNSRIQLHDPRQRGAQYERATVYAISYKTGTIPDDEILVDDLKYMLRLLSQLYQREAMSLIESLAVNEDHADFDSRENDLWTELLVETLRDESDLEDIVNTVHTSSKQIILAGPPGTGKTRLALFLAKYLTGNDPTRSHLVQFHPNYGYEEFVEGIRPVAVEGMVSFEVRPGIVKQIATEAAQSADTHVLIIDEINRANIPRVFGELMFLLEYRNIAIDLQYSKGFRLPPNVIFIGTMNTADRSIRSIDVALRRRFEIFSIPPDSDILRQFYDSVGVNEVAGLVEGFDMLNDKLVSYLDMHHTIGHTYFMREHLTPNGLRNIWQRQVAPLIEEYFFDQPDIVNEFAIEQFWPDQ